MTRPPPPSTRGMPLVASRQLLEGASSIRLLPSPATGIFTPFFYHSITRKHLQGAWGCLGGGGLQGLCFAAQWGWLISVPRNPVVLSTLIHTVWLPLVYICLEGSGSKKHNHFLASLPVSAASWGRGGEGGWTDTLKGTF